jgi:tetratricopeptide (TPR) repeat protein
VGCAAGAAVALALGPDRLRRAWLASLAVGAVAVSAARLLEPYDAFAGTGATPAAAVADAVRVVALLGAGGFLAALLLCWLEPRLDRDERASRRASVVALAAVLLAAVALTGNPVGHAREALAGFEQDAAASGSVDPQRYDLWRIAWQEAIRNKLGGLGEGGYAASYYRERDTDRDVADPHSLPLRVLAENGLIGAFLLAAVAVAALVAVKRGWRPASAAEQRTASAIGAAGVALVAQASIDSLWLLPAVAGPGLMGLAAAVAILSLPRDAREPAPGTPRVVRLAGSAVPALAAAFVLLLFLSDVYDRAARDGSLAGRLDAARTAERLDPLALGPRHRQAGVLERMGRRDEARRELLAALEREPESFATMTLLGELEARAGDRAAARGWYRRALALNPRDARLRQLAR